MLYSMTGFGKGIFNFNDKIITIEIKSLNSKQLDLNTKIPNRYRDKELDYRNIISKGLSRGKIDMTMKVESTDNSNEFSINTETAKKYLEEIQKIETSLDIRSKDYTAILMNLPGVVNAKEEDEVQQVEYDAIMSALNEAVENANKYRRDEGKILEQDFIKRINLIINYLSQIEPFEKARIENIRTRIVTDLSTVNIDYDKNRFEQEMIYYIEKLDITEEKVRLANHCDYFLKTLEGNESQGKLLTFISQEIGREINTIGSKANNMEIQQIVVKMKDELEKIREQLANIL